MKLKLTKTKHWTFILFSLFPVFLMGQDTLLWSEDFSTPNTNLPAFWSSSDISSNPDDMNVFWEHCTNPDTCEPFTDTSISTNRFHSTSSENGYLLANPQNYIEAANADTPPFEALLESPAIELPEGTEELFLEYQSLLGVNTISAHEGAQLSIKINNGAWQNRSIYPLLPIPLDQYHESHNANFFLENLTEYITEEANTIQFRWIWTGRLEEFWCLDDIKLYNYNPLNERVIWNSGGFNGGLNGWTVNAPLGDTCNWTWQPFGYYGNAFLNESPNTNDNKFINSPTARNGAMILNADYCFTQDAPPAPSTPIDPIVSELISPIFDLSATTEEPILDFYQVIRPFGATVTGYPFPFSYAFSTNGGLSWSDFFPLNNNLPENLTHHTHESIILPPEVIGQPMVQIKFVFAAEFFFWGIDDIRILERPDYDLKISEEFYAIPPNYGTPLSQIDSIPFLVDIENLGTEFQSNILVKIEVINTLTNQVVHTDSVLIDEIAPLEIVENILFPTTFLPPILEAQYEGTYSISSANTDEIPENNQIQFQFEITDFQFKKEKNTSIGYKPGANDYAWGNSFYVPNGEGMYASKVIFGLENALQLEGASVGIELYEWETNADDIFLATPDEYTLIAENVYEINGSENDKIIYNIDFSGENIPLKDSTHYFVVVRYNRLSGSPNCFLSTSQDLDYKASFVTSDIRNSLRYSTMVEEQNSGIYNVVGLGDGFNFVPQVRLWLSDSPNATIETQGLNNKKILISPNPSTEQIMVTLPQNTDGIVRITNLKGQIVFSQDIKKTDGMLVKIQTSSFGSGLYFLTLIAKDWQGYEKIVVSK